MLSEDFSINVTNLSKRYSIYETPRDRLKQFLFPSIRRLFHKREKQYFREFWALRDISFSIKRGETLGIIGLNGSGKSTLLQIICGTLAPTSGTVRTNGRIAALLELGSGFNPEFSGRENVYLNATVLGLSRAEIDKKFEDIAEFAGIGDFIDQPIKTYSSGMFVRLAFAVVAHVEADILVVDEALAVGDALFTQKCMRFLRQFKETGTLIFVSHDSGAITGLCDRAIWLDKGIVVQNGDAKAVSEAYLAALYSKDDQKSKSTNSGSRKPVDFGKVKPLDVVMDARSEKINNSNLRNDLKIFEFTPGASADFGLRNAEITKVEMTDSFGNVLNSIVGGELVSLAIEVFVSQDLEQVIIGFSVKDRLGQILFGDNTFLSYENNPINAKRNAVLRAEFVFQMPVLVFGEFSIAAAVATGTQSCHEQQHWIHDALIIKSTASSISTGLIGLPMHKIQVVSKKVRNDEPVTSLE